MALSDGKLLGSWDVIPGAVFRVKYINGKFYGIQEAPEFGLGAFLIRDRKFFQNTSISGVFTAASNVSTEDIALLETASGTGNDNYGVSLTAQTNIVGYLKKQSGVNIYFISEEDLKADVNQDGVADTVVRSANVFTQAWDWIKANPLLSAGIALAVYMLWKSSQGKGKKKGFLAGLL